MFTVLLQIRVHIQLSTPNKQKDQIHSLGLSAIEPPPLTWKACTTILCLEVAALVIAGPGGSFWVNIWRTEQLRIWTVTKFTTFKAPFSLALALSHLRPN